MDTNEYGKAFIHYEVAVYRPIFLYIDQNSGGGVLLALVEKCP